MKYKFIINSNWINYNLKYNNNKNRKSIKLKITKYLTKIYNYKQ